MSWWIYILLLSLHLQPPARCGVAEKSIIVMAKVTQMAGIAVGKVGAIVYSVRNGQQIARQYQPNVANPNTNAQLGARSRLKLLSQLSQVLSTVIVARRSGAQSARNVFTRINYPFTSWDGAQAQIGLANIQLTDSSLPLSGFDVTRADGRISMVLQEDMSALYDNVVYVILAKQSSGGLLPVGSVIAAPGGDGVFAASDVDPVVDCVVCAYGVRETSSAARAAFADYALMSASDVASVAASRLLSVGDLVFSETRGIYLAAGSSEGGTTGRVAVNVLLASGVTAAMGSVSGGGSYAPLQSVTLNATPAADYRFKGWYSDAAHTQLVSASARYAFVVGDEDVTLYAWFEDMLDAG